MADVNKECPQTFLSSRVKNMICHEGVIARIEHTSLTNHYTIDWVHLESMIKDLLQADENEEELLLENTRQMSSLFLECEQLLENQTCEQYRVTYNNLLDWIANKQIFFECLSLVLKTNIESQTREHCDMSHHEQKRQNCCTTNSDTYFSHDVKFNQKDLMRLKDLDKLCDNACGINTDNDKLYDNVNGTSSSNVTSGDQADKIEFNDNVSGNDNDNLSENGKDDNECSDNDNADELLSLLVITSCLERSLGDVYLMKGRQCPSILKDLLNTEELKHILGPVVVNVLKVIIGSPKSLNIRNIAWHGFFSPGELPKRYVYFLLVLIPSIGEILKYKNVKPETIPHRPPIQLPQDMYAISVNFTQIYECLNSVIGEDNIFILHCMMPYLQRSLFYYERQRYGYSLCLLWPLLEHSLRCVFADANNCQYRVLTAESTSFYTTFEEILCKHIKSDEDNKLVKIIGEPCMDLLYDVLMYLNDLFYDVLMYLYLYFKDLLYDILMYLYLYFKDLLYDVLVYPEGPRLRDRLSHGETDLSDVSKDWIDKTWYILIYLIYEFQYKDKHKVPETVTKFKDTIEKYESQYHPIALLKKKILCVVNLTCNMIEWIKIDPTLKSWKSTADGFEIFINDNPSYKKLETGIKQFIEHQISDGFDAHVWYCEIFNNNKDIIDQLLSRKISTLYRFDDVIQDEEVQSSRNTIKESEIVTLLLRINIELETVLIQLQSITLSRQEKLYSKQLRSRQRDNTQKLLYCLPVIHVSIHFICIFTVYQLYKLQSYTQSHLKLLQRCLKLTLKFSENLRTFTGSDKNKWQEAMELCVKNIEKLCNFLIEFSKS
ncbi:hypothetical protein LOTGIDRAFT_229422 [Lottia gigantea]|uniref:DUF4209 domain-containing protein n=1 Tax=Lottia gigantea TaxID=225164 RepID=V3ZSA3_LOTGI|nr:hypothetical protein LOTGIDRAFT_229422 [Lottia gigantea]ESO85400.1 hypothetical protein LOTGIDRAFT_229422 [Lottia gigantea]